ncbi:MurR/RpiR family transcriptional regulator [Oryzifoliimicrobium ureilyticus]|uniref:MurR/RpiR family transcriptional regulator n=1 Tax=Oryzifoliimicrobium ureilyticus TaxID=3113724 RepID=UPI00307659A3
MNQVLQNDPLRSLIVERFDGMSPQLQQAARHIIEHPQEVALVSMRELARSAGVQPSTMTRLAKFLGLSGYDDIRMHYAELIRGGSEGFAARAALKGGRRRGEAKEGLAERMLSGLSAQIASLCEPHALARLGSAATRLYDARRIYVLGLRSCHSVVWHFHYVMNLLGQKSVHLDGQAGTGGDGLIRAGAQDVLLVISINPYARETLELAEVARGKGMGVVAITDSEVSPLVSLADEVILCPTESLTFFHTLTPALAISEVLCGLLAARDESASLEELKRVDQHLKALNTYATSIPHRKI